MHIYRGEESNYRLRGEPVKMVVKVTPVFDAPGTDAWETDGGAPAPLPYEEEIRERYRTPVRSRVGRKQRAAKLARPIESITVVPLAKKPAPMEVVAVRMEGGTTEEEQIAALESRIKVLLGLVRK
jgi:hypothetical protein